MNRQLVGQIVTVSREEEGIINCISFLFVAGTKYLTNNVKEKWFILTHGFRVYGLLAQRQKQQGRGKLPTL